jgi:hydroxymethylpyrimidine/phosphomethylpyrimidine kinase
MGNLEVKEKFANHSPEGAEKLTLTSAVLFEEELVQVILQDMITQLNIQEPNWDELFTITNVQKNTLEERHHEDALSTHLQENYMAGFQTAESQLQSLKESSKCP